MDSRRTTERPSAAAWLVTAVMALFWLAPLAPLVTGRRAVPAWLVADLVTGVPAALLLLVLAWRRPQAGTWVLAGALVVCPSVVGAAWAAQSRLAATARPATWSATAVGLVTAKVVSLCAVEGGGPDSAFWFELLVTTFGVVVATLVGRLAHSREGQAASAQAAAAAQADAEAARIREARLAERELLAREMHDVVAHRLSLVALHSAALTHRSDLTPEQIQETARLIRVNARASLDELRAMLTELRSPDLPPQAPQPSLAELGVLVAEAREAGQRIDLDLDLDAVDVPAAASRHAFRIVQECLTNARKHAPGAPVDVRVWREGDGLRIVCSNPVSDLAPDAGGARLGLVGVAERASLLGGQTTHGIRDGRFVVEAYLPAGRALEETAR